MFRVLLLSAMGLGALYMMHLLAQDYNKITRPRPSLPIAKGRFIRDTSNYSDNRLTESDKIEIRWDKILEADPFGCARSLICQLHAEEVVLARNTGNESLQEEEIKILLILIRSTWKSLPQPMKTSFTLGKYGQSDKCYSKYPLCFYSAKTMVSFLKLYNKLAGRPVARQRV